MLKDTYVYVGDVSLMMKRCFFVFIIYNVYGVVTSRMVDSTFYEENMVFMWHENVLIGIYILGL